MLQSTYQILPQNWKSVWCFLKYLNKLHSDISKKTGNGLVFNTLCHYSCGTHDGGTYPGPAARTCSCQSVLPELNPWSKKGLEKLKTQFHGPCQSNPNPPEFWFEIFPHCISTGTKTWLSIPLQKMFCLWLIVQSKKQFYGNCVVEFPKRKCEGQCEEK